MSNVAEFFAPYEGAAPYLFVSYSHRDTETVLATIHILRDRLVRLWYDEGIPAGSDWPRVIEERLRASDTVLFFLSAPAMESPNCTSEVATAHELGKPIVVVPLDGCAPTPVFKDLLADATWVDDPGEARSRAQAILDVPGLAERLQGAESDYTRSVRRVVSGSGWAVASRIAAVLLAAAIALLAALATGVIAPFTPDAPAQNEPSAPSAAPASPAVDLSAYGDIFVDAMAFPDAQQERAVRAALGASSGAVPRERLLELTSLHFVGPMTPATSDGIVFLPDGTCTLNGAALGEGQVKDLSLIADMPYLEQLTLTCQPLANCEGLAGHTALRELSLAGSPVSDLSGLSDLPALQTLHLEHTAVADLTVLASLPALATVTVSADMLPIHTAPDAPFDLVLVR